MGCESLCFPPRNLQADAAANLSAHFLQSGDPKREASSESEALIKWAEVH
jgi:hypothetical protein